VITLRPAQRSDLPDLHRIWWATGSSPGKHNPWFAHVLKTGLMVVATDDEEVVAFAGRRLVWETNVISDCFVDPDHQGSGIGTQMLSFLLPRGAPAMTLASDDPKAHSLYRRFGMRPVVDCPYLQVEAAGTLELPEIDSFPVPDEDLAHLRIDLGCNFVRSGSSVAALTMDSIETSFLSESDGAIVVFQEFLAACKGPTIEIQMAESHPAYGSFAFTEKFRDTLMASDGAQIPDPRRVTFNGDLLAVGY
jgi:GNAT superfamily N-acetyltransferase